LRTGTGARSGERKVLGALCVTLTVASLFSGSGLVPGDPAPWPVSLGHGPVPGAARTPVPMTGVADPVAGVDAGQPGPGASSPAEAAAQVPSLASVSIQLTAQPRRGVIPLAVQFGAAARGGPLATQFNFSWSFGDGSSPVVHLVTVAAGTSAADAVNHTYAQVGSYIASVNVSDGVDPNASATIGISATLPLTVIGTAVPGTVTAGRPILLQGTAAGGSPPYTYVWSGVPPGCVVNGPNLTCVPKQVGNYSVMLQVTDSVSDQATTHVGFSVNPKLVASGSYVTWYHCVGSTSYLTENFSGGARAGTPPYAFQWNPGDGSANLTGKNVTHNYTQGTTFNVTLTVTDASGATSNKTIGISTAFTACGGIPPTTATDVTLVVSLTVGAAAAVTALVVYYRRLGRPRATAPSTGPTSSPPSPPAVPPHVDGGSTDSVPDHLRD
jgi:PKD repeat protein